MTGPAVAYQGAPGAFGEEAARLRWRDSDPRPVPTFDGVLEGVGAGRVDYGVLPVWNSVLGDIVAARAALAGAHGVRVTGEVEVPVELCLLARPGVIIGALRHAGSHPAALGQCGRFLARHPEILPCPVWDTAGAARELAEDGAEGWPRRVPGATAGTVAAIAGVRAAEQYGLAVLASGIQDMPGNRTRFVILERSGGTP